LTMKEHIFLTTSRKPTQTIRTFCKDIPYTFATNKRINRGKLSLEGVAEKALELDLKNVVLVDRWKGMLGKIQLFNSSRDVLEPVMSIICVKDVKFRRDFGEKMPKGRKTRSIAIAASTKKTLKIEKLEDVLSRFLSIPVLSLEEAVSGSYDTTMQILMDP